MDSWVASAPDLSAYAQDQLGSPTLNVAAEYQNMKTAVQAVINWITTNFPKDGVGFAMAYTLAADGTRVPAQFTPAQTAGLRTALNNAAASIS